MSEKENQVLELPALGRPFSLGTLYDSRTEKVIPGMTLWDPDTLANNVMTKTISSTSYQFQSDESFSAKSTALGIDANLKLSILGGLVEVSGSASYLNDKKKTSHQERVSLHYNSMSHTKSLTMAHLGKGNAQHPEIFDNDIATHVVTGIQFGSRAVFVFDRKLTEEEEKTEASGSLKGILKGIPMVSAEGDISLDFNKEEKAKIEQISCCLYSEGFKGLGTASTFMEAIMIYREFPSHIDAVPITVFLYPLGLLDSQAQRIVRQISMGLVDQTVKSIESLEEVIVKAEDLLSHGAVMKTSTRIKQHLIRFKSLVTQTIMGMKNKVLQVLPKIRGAAVEETEISNILKEWLSSPCNTESLEMWLSNIAQEVRILKSVLGQIQDVTDILEHEGDLVSYHLNHDLKKLVCLVIRMPDSTAKYLVEIQAYQEQGVKTQGGENDQPHWYDNTDTIQAMASRLQVFSEYAKFVKKSDKEVKCFIFERILTQDDLEGGKTPGANIMLYEHGKLIDDDFTPGGPPHIVKHVGSLTALEFATFRIDCRFKGVFQAEASWFKDGKQIVGSSGKYETINTPIGSDLVVHNALIESDAGTYRVVLSNNQGSASQDVEVSIQVSPHKVPIGTILAWTPKLDASHTSGSGEVSLPRGWQLCDGSKITDESSPWRGKNTPDLTERFLRGGNEANALKLQEDQLQDHKHQDGGHTHNDSGHDHRDGGHGHSDSGHNHSYEDTGLTGRGNHCAGRYWGQGTWQKTTATAHANIQTGHANIQRGHANLTTSHCNIQGVSGARVGTETRPRSAYIMWIIKISG